MDLLTKLKTRKFIIIIIVSFFIIVLSILVLSTVYNNPKDITQIYNEPATSSLNLIDGERVDNQGCQGTGPVTFGASPMAPSDIGMILPYGGMVGAHVTPIDHMYFSPKIFNSPRDTYEVRAMADGIITAISERSQNVSDEDNGSPKLPEYQIKFWYTCDFASYYDLITSLSPRLKAEFETHKNGSSANFNIPLQVKEGEVVGKIGGQTLDFAVYDYTKILSGFIVPEHYLSESWKLHVVDPFQYFEEPIRSQLLDLNIRQVEPREGKLDYDVDGRLVGTWFKEGNNGFGSTGGENPAPWRAHLSFAYDSIDPTALVISIGDFGGESHQFAVRGNAPDPAVIDLDSGLIRYELSQLVHYRGSTGEHWDRRNIYSDIKMRPSEYVQGVVLVQLIGQRRIKFQAFPGRTIDEVTDFDGSEIIYER